MYLCKFAFTSIKSDDFQLYYVIFESKKKKIPDLSLPPCIRKLSQRGVKLFSLDNA
jgi:hypothetical protein